MQAVQQEQRTALYGVPTMFMAQLALLDFERYDLSSLRKGIMAGSPCPQDTMQKVLHRPHASSGIVLHKLLPFILSTIGASEILSSGCVSKHPAGSYAMSFERCMTYWAPVCDVSYLAAASRCLVCLEYELVTVSSNLTVCVASSCSWCIINTVSLCMA